jgi:hypothetical protein
MNVEKLINRLQNKPGGALVRASAGPLTHELVDVLSMGGYCILVFDALGSDELQGAKRELHLHFHPPEGAVLHGVGDVIEITPAPTPQVPNPAPKIEYQIGWRVQWKPIDPLIGMVRGAAISVDILDGPKEDGSYIVETGKWGRLKIWPDEILPVVVKRSDAAPESI